MYPHRIVGLLNVKDIYDFASTCDLDDVRSVLDRQIELNTAISQEGLSHAYGANIGKVLLKTGSDVRTRAKAAAAAGSDADSYRICPEARDRGESAGIG